MFYSILQYLQKCYKDLQYYSTEANLNDLR